MAQQLDEETRMNLISRMSVMMQMGLDEKAQGMEAAIKIIYGEAVADEIVIKAYQKSQKR